MENYIWPKITKDIPMEELKRIHQAIWDYVIKYGKKPKTPYLLGCVCCAYDSWYLNDCNYCPIIWPKNLFGHATCAGDNGLHTQWLRAIGEEKTALAHQIRDLPWKFEIEGENGNV